MKNNYNFSVGDVLDGVIIKILPFGVIVSLEDHVQGLVHISHLHNKFINNIEDHFAIQDLVKVKVLSIDSVNKKIALSIKDAIATSPVVNQRTSTKFQAKSSNADLPEKSHFETIMSNWVKESNDKIESINRRTKRRSWY